MRGVSTVLDVTVCLLLISAAVGVLALPVTEPAPERNVDETAAVLSTVTHEIEYTISTKQVTAPSELESASDGTERPRTRHGTLAGLAGRAAFSSMAVRDTPVAPESAGFRDRVVTTIEGTIPPRTYVRAHWEPYPDATVTGTVEAGVQPPPGADVQASTRRVPLPEVTVTPDEETFEGIATAIATEVVTSLVPERAGERPMGDPLVVAAVVHRFEVLGTHQATADAYIAGDIDTLVEDAVNSLSATIEVGLRDQFDSADAAATEITAGFVWLTIQRWES